MAQMTMAFDPADQRTRRRRALVIRPDGRRVKVTQHHVGECFPTPISGTAVGNYERRDHDLPLDFDGQNYEDALKEAIRRLQAGEDF